MLGGKEYNRMFPYLGTPNMEQFDQLMELFITEFVFYPPAFLEGTSRDLTGDTVEGRDMRFRNAMLIYVFCLPLHEQSEASSCYPKFYYRKDVIYSFIKNNWDTLYKVYVSKTLSPWNTPLLGKTWYNDNGNMKVPTIALERLVTSAARGTSEERRKHGNKLPHDIIWGNILTLLLTESGLRTYQLSQAILNAKFGR